MPGDSAYISVVQWPDGMTEEERVAAVRSSVGLDDFAARALVRRGAPLVLRRVEEPGIEGALVDLERRGVVAFAASVSQLKAVKAARRVKRLFPAPGGYVCEMWKGEGEPLKHKDGFLLVRATLRNTTTRTTGSTDRTSVAAGYYVGGLAGAAFAASITGSPDRTTRTALTEILDVYLADGRCLRLDGDKLNFDVLGADKGITDRQNMTLLCDRLRSQMPGAMYDTAFETFACPPQIAREGVRYVGNASVRTRNDRAPFEFYSAWAFLLYRYLLTPGASVGG
ncbi:MAG: hypothetical protein H6811_03405 [Phycisphaeraceae bacterium]|nr:hypothetical protein [Phycisphaeraceae bacterium]